MKKQMINLLNGMKAKGYKYSWVIPEDEVIYVQKELNLKEKTDDELFELWNTVEETLSELLDSQLYELVKDYKITILTIINESKSFKTGIKY